MFSPGTSGIMVTVPLESAWMKMGVCGGAGSSSCLFVQIHTARTTWDPKIRDCSRCNPATLIMIIAPGAVILNFSAFLPVPIFLFLPAVLLCAWMAVESIQFHLVVISGKSFLTCRSSEVGDFVPRPFSEVCAFPCTLLCGLYTALAPQGTGRNIVLVSRHFAMSEALCVTHLKFSREKNEDMCRMDYATQQRVLVIFHLKYQLQYNLIIIFLFSSLSSRFHINITAPLNSCLLRQLSFRVRIRNSVDLVLCKTIVKRELQFFSLGSFSKALF